MMTAATTLSRASSVVGVGAGATSRRPVDRAVSAVATSSSYSRRARRVATVRAASSRTSSSATTTTTTTTRSALAMETPSTTTTDADDDDDKTGVVPSLRELRAAIPAECFVPCLRESMKYAAIDLGLLAACFGLWSPLVVDNPWMLPLYAPVTGTIMWMCFVVGHDCGHGSFSENKWINGVVGHATHSPLLVPFYPWAYSHKQHHRFHNHEEKDMSHPWMSAERYKDTNAIVRFLALDHPWGAFLGFPGYLLLEPKWSSTDGSHFNPAGRLFDRAPKDERLKCAVSTVACAAFLLATFAACDGPAQWATQYLAPYLCFSWWLFTVTYLQHHDHDTKTYKEGEWEYVLGGLETIDREFGYGVDEATHHITDCHVAHHMFSDMPHYNLEKATAGVRGVLEPRGLYKKRDTRDFATKIFGLHKDVGHCVEPDRPRATKEELVKALGRE